MQGHFLLIFSVCAFLSVNVTCLKASQDQVPEIMSDITWNGTDSLSSGDLLSYNVCINHAMSSHTNAFNVRLRWMFSNSLKFETLNQTVGPKINIEVYSSYFDVEVQHLHRQQQVCCNLMFVFDPDMSLSSGRHFVTTLTQLSCDDQPIFGTRYTNHWETLSYSIEVPGCSDELGVTSGEIRDHQMTSSSYLIGHEPFKARLNNSDGWCAAVLDDTQFLQIDFIHEVRITRLLAQGMNIHVGVEQFVLEYSLDDKNWRNYTEYGTTRLFSNTLNKDSGSIHWLVKPFKAYNVRLRPTKWNTSICLMVELYGCEDLKTQVSCILPLGMESGFITDEALSTSLDHSNPYDSRLGKKVIGHGGWLASPFITDDYLQIDLAVLYSFTKIAVEGEWSESGMANRFVRKYTVMISNDSLVWQNYTENGKLKVFDGPISSLAAIYPTLVKLAEPVVTRYIRILPQEQSGYRVMRLEVYGCLKEPMPSYFVPNDFSRRSYLLNNLTGDFYVCLYSDDRTESSCQYTRDGYTWKKLSKRIVKILAIDSRDLTIYVLDRSNSYLRHSGNDWTVISREQWKRVKLSLSLILAKDMPENLLRKDHNGGEILESSNGYQWTVSHTDLHMKSPGGNWVLVARWKCCNQ